MLSRRPGAGTHRGRPRHRRGGRRGAGRRRRGGARRLRHPPDGAGRRAPDGQPAGGGRWRRPPALPLHRGHRRHRLPLLPPQAGLRAAGRGRTRAVDDPAGDAVPRAAGHGLQAARPAALRARSPSTSVSSRSPRPRWPSGWPALVEAGPSGRAADFGGPGGLALRELAQPVAGAARTARPARQRAGARRRGTGRSGRAATPARTTPRAGRHGRSSSRALSARPTEPPAALAGSVIVSPWPSSRRSCSRSTTAWPG